MSAQNRECLEATIYNLDTGNLDLFEELANMPDEDLERILNEILKK